MRLRYKKLSLIGMVLMGASALVAAMVPKDKKDTTDVAQNGRLQFSTGNAGDLTCVPASINPNCHYTATHNEDDRLGSSTSSEGSGSDSHNAGNSTGTDTTRTNDYN